MLTYLRYALATFCFAASVLIIAWWLRSWSHYDLMRGPARVAPATELLVESSGGIVTVAFLPQDGDRPYFNEWHRLSNRIQAYELEGIQQATRKHGWFGTHSGNLFFPHWYPALIFALAGAAALRLSRRFTLRSAIIATTVVAGLLGMALIL